MDVGHRGLAVSTALDGIQSVHVLVSPVRRGTSTHVLTRGNYRRCTGIVDYIALDCACVSVECAVRAGGVARKSSVAVLG